MTGLNMRGRARTGCARTSGPRLGSLSAPPLSHGAGAAGLAGAPRRRLPFPGRLPRCLLAPIRVEVAVNQATHTIYVGNGGENTVSVINGTPLQRHSHLRLRPKLQPR